jgi:aspartate/methionine/tyrosine aminotransferase
MKIETFALERWMTTWETKTPYDIAESGIFPMTVRELLAFEPPQERDRILEELLGLRLGYSEARGTLALRSAIAATYRATGPEEILVTTGAIEANFLLFHVLLEPGDHVVAAYPAYQQLYSLPRIIGCDVSLWKLRANGGFRYDLDELERLVTARTRLIVLNTPHNPTGAMLSAEELVRIERLAASVKARVLSDEAYRWLEIPGGSPLAPPMRDLGGVGVSVGTLSKPFGLPGLRIGWMAGPAELVAKCWGLRDYVSLSPGRLNDALALLAFKHRDRIVERTRAIVEANLAAARAWFDRHAEFVSWTPPRGGLLALLRYAFDVPSLELSNRLAEKHGVMLAPGSAFGVEHHLRIGIGQEPKTFAEGLRRTWECLESLRREGVPVRRSFQDEPIAV